MPQGIYQRKTKAIKVKVDKTATKTATKQKYANAIMELFNKNKYKPFHGSVIHVICEKFHVTRALGTFLTQAGLIKPVTDRKKGYHVFVKEPTNSLCLKTYNLNIETVRIHNQEKTLKKKELKTLPVENEVVNSAPFPIIPSSNTDVQATPIRKLSPINEEMCVQYLKDHGYKVFKPVTEFKEC